ncbi:lipopolysaccharide biosynthesis protein [Duganella sp. P38]|uniref:lipopolysaccharide biosynthesis protein n=1 Tax=Duganella sp. P38 TaxID=3423949 RepID=UPI003D7AF3EC
MSQINQRMATGIVWMIGARLTDRAIGMVSTLLLARLLAPDDFGLVAMATAIGGMLDLLGSFSFDLALIQKQNASRRHYDTVWTLNVIFGLLCCAAMVALAVPAAQFYREPRLSTVMYVLSLMYLVNAFANVGVVNFRKELNFRQEFIFIFARRLVTFTITVGAALLLHSYWALLLGMCIGRCVTVAMSYMMNDYRPWFSLAAVRELFHFSKWMLLNNALGFLRHDGCTFIIGRQFGAAGLGVYSVSYEISNLPSTELVAPINRVTFPGFAKMAEPALIRASYFRLLGMIALLILPVGIGIASVAEPLVLAMLGDKWLQAPGLIAILAISGAICATQTNNASVWLALGRPRQVAVVQAVYLAVLFPSLYFFMQRDGIVGAGYAYLCAQLVDVAMEMSASRRMLDFAWRDVLAVVWRPLLGVTLMYLAVRWLDHRLLDWHPWPRLLVDAAAGAAVYIASVVGLWWLSARPNSAEHFCLQRLKVLPA